MNLNEFSDEYLLALYEERKDIARSAGVAVGQAEQEIFRRIRERGATGIPSDRYECVEKKTYSYDQTKLMPLREPLSPAELAECFEEGHEKTEWVDPKFNVTKLKKVAKIHGKEMLGQVEAARFETGRKLEFKRKES